MKSNVKNRRFSRRVPVALTLVCLLILGFLRLAAFAQEPEETPPAPTGASAGKATVFIDKDRNAVIQLERQKPMSDGSSGTANGGLDLGGGLTAFTLNMDLGRDAKDFKGAKITAYGQVDGATSSMLGTLSIPLPQAEPPQQPVIRIDAKIQQNDKNLHSDITGTAQIPSPGTAPITRLGIDLQSKTDYKTVNSTIKLDVAAEAIKQVPLRNLDLTVTEPDANTTNLEANITLDLTNEMYKQQFESIKSSTQKIEEAIKSNSFVTVESVSLKAEQTGNEGKVTLALKATGLRAKITEFAGMMSQRQVGSEIDPNVLKQSIDSMLAFTFDKLNIKASVQNDALTATITVDGKNLDKLLTGYSALMSNIQEASFRKMQERAGGDQMANLALRWVHAIQTHVNELSQTWMTEAANSGVTVTQNLKLTVEVKDKIVVDGSYVQDSNNFDKVHKALKDKGFPVAEAGGLVAHVKTEGAVLNGTFYGSAKGDVPKMIKALLVEPATKDPMLKAPADTLNGIQWQDGRMALQLTDTKLQIGAYSKTSDLTTLFSQIQLVGAKDLIGTPAGARGEANVKDNVSNSTVRLGFKGFMPGKSSNDVKAVVTSLLKVEDVTVNETADANQAMLAALDQPKIEMPAELAAVKTEGETTVAAVPPPGSSGSSGGTGPGGMSTGVLIGIGVAVLALLGIVMASAGRKK